MTVPTLARPVAFDPNQPRDPDGKWGHGLGHVIEKLFKFDNGDLDMHVDDDGLHLAYGDSKSGAFTRGGGDNPAWKLSALLEGDSNGPFPRSNSVASYPPDEAGASPTGYAQVTQLSPTQYRLELLNNDTTFDLSHAEAKRLSDALTQAGGSRRIDTGHGPLDVYVTDDHHIALRTVGHDGKPVEMHFDETSWDRLNAAIIVIHEGYDESGNFGHSVDEDVNELRIHTNVGELELRRVGVPPDQGYMQEGALEIGPADRNDWTITVPAELLQTMWQAFEDAQGAAAYQGQNRLTTALRALAARRRESHMQDHGRHVTLPAAVQPGADLAGQLASLRRGRLHATLRNGRRDWYRIANADAGAAEVYLFDEIGFWGISAQDFAEDLRGITAPVINLHVNSPGGEVFDGIAIYNTLRQHPATVNVFIDGLAASAASFIAQAGNRVTIARHARMMIHDASGLCIGNADDMRTLADLLDGLSGTIADIYTQRAGGSVEFWRSQMRAETWYTAQEAVDAGLADEVGGDLAAADAPAEMRNTWDLTVFRYAGRDQAPAPEVASAANAAVGSGGEPGADAVGGTVEPPPEPTAEPTPAAPEPPAEPVADDTPAPLVPDPPTDTTQDDWADLVAQLETAPPTVDDALVRLREA